MTNYLIRRFFQMMLVVFLSTVAIYALLNLAPGGPLDGLKLAADRKQRVTEADIARLEAYLGLDKPVVLRYITWMLGDDWLGADWMYVGLGRYKQVALNTLGQPILEKNPDTGELVQVYETARFWAGPSLVNLNPGYKLWVWGQKGENNEITADKIQVKPATTAKTPEDAVFSGVVVNTVGMVINASDLNEVAYKIVTTRNTEYVFPTGEGDPRPSEGNWVDVSWLFGADGLLGKYSGFNGSGHGVLRLDFGTSWKLSKAQTVSGMLASRLGNTIILMLTSTILSLVIAIPIGIYSAIHQYSKVDYIVTTFAFFGSAMPVFWFGLMLILIFNNAFMNWGLPYFPSGGVQLVREAPTGSLLNVLNAAPGSFTDRVIHIILPAIMLSLLYMAGWSRYMRSSMLEVLRQDFVRTARAKGLIERVVIVKHALRNALIPIITIVVFQIPALFGGATLTETVFSFPGIGRLYYDALTQDDWPIVMAILFISSVLVVFATLLGDILYTVVDPRIRF